VFLAPATASIIPMSSKPPKSKMIAMEFVNSSKERQTEMLRDPDVARAILQTLSESGHSGGAQMVSLLGQSLGSGALDQLKAQAPGAAPALPPPPMPALGEGTSAWAGSITLARNMGKRLTTRSTLLHGKVQDVEVALRSAAGNFNVLDITHRVPFDEVARRVSTGTVLSMMVMAPHEQPALEEYAKYFRTKMRAGVARLDGNLSLYVLPPGDDVPALRDSLYTLLPHAPRAGCLIGLVAQGTAGGAPASGAAGQAAAGAARGAGEAAAIVPAASGSAGQGGGRPAVPALADAAAAAAGTAAPAAPVAAAAARQDQPQQASQQQPQQAQQQPGKAAASPAAAAAVAQDKPAKGGVAETSAAPAAQDAPKKTEKKVEEEAPRGDDSKDDGGLDMSSMELLDLFSNPELIKLLSDEADGANGQSS